MIEDWEEIRNIPRAVLAEEALDLLDARRDVQDLPEHFYHVVKGFGIDFMAIFKVRCRGEVRRNRRMGGLAYCGILEEILWKGPSYRVRPEEQGKKYSYSKDKCDLTLEEAALRFNEYRQEHLQTSRDNIIRWEENIADLQKSIADTKRRDAEAEALDIAMHLRCP